MTAPASTRITRLVGEDEARACAEMMSSTEPWITLRRGHAQSLALILDPTREVYVARSGDALVGFAILCMTGALVGYVQSVCVQPAWRGRGIGSQLMRFAEDRILRESPNVFLCVSSFNTEARRLYQRLGYEPVGELRDYIVTGHSELLLRKTIGPISK
jgi:[ribosomal protein S18]-alanine N-acetyltransferase